jgi:hypothetical protein
MKVNVMNTDDHWEPQILHYGAKSKKKNKAIPVTGHRGL